MEPVDEIFAAFGDSPTTLAREAGAKVQTVHAWRVTLRNIPTWRRAAVLAAVERLGLVLSPAALAYLGDTGAAPAEAAAA